MTALQPTKLLASLFAQLEEEQRLTVLHVGAALPETVHFFSAYRSKLHFLDLFADLPIVADEEAGETLEQRFADLLQFPAGTRFDLCLFWDLFNFMDGRSVQAFTTALYPYLHSRSLGHGFAVHNLRTPQGDQLYGISDLDQLSIRHRPHALPGYHPHTQGQLEKLLDCFSFTRSVLLPDSRLELLLHARLQDSPGSSLRQEPVQVRF